MTDVAFHTGIANPLDYACRLLRKAYRSGARVAVHGEPAVLDRLDQALWTFEALEFVPHIVVTHPQGPRDNLALYRLLGAVFGADVAAERLCAAFEEAYDEVASVTRERQDVLYLIWRDPWMTIARETYIAQTLALVNWQTFPEGGPDRYPEVDLASLSGQVDRVLLSSEPYHFHEHHRAVAETPVPLQAIGALDQLRQDVDRRGAHDRAHGDLLVVHAHGADLLVLDDDGLHR